ncbi:hypothetical protein [Spirosoma spitsbergense]|jgi:hypothetical protein|uniref:hypothetical protein n=1 Tax=Spirosoma spitsbergense TaxID=431554 RepID=UPI00039DE5FE|nr:hypothetical protein [Spirosoma spitsbergense]
MTNRSVCLLLLLSVGLVFPSIAQSIYEIPGNKPVEIDGIEYGYSVRNECTKDFINLGTFKRYELIVYVTNRSGNSKVFNPRQTSFGTRDQDLLAHFDCLNATGAKLTSKTIAVRARPASTPYEASAKSSPGDVVAAKTTDSLPVGHLLEKGETITNNIIVIVPDGESPQMRVRVRKPDKSPTR